MTVFYRKYRPQKLADLYGQEKISETLISQLEKGNISHGYLFYGSKGTGKTSTARVLAKAVNCEKYRQVKGATFGEPCNKCVSCVSITNGSNLDVLEIDAASNRGVDEIRDLREKVKLSPVSSRFKVYIIDEAHMLTNEAFNALLKTLEEPPAHVIFILATTEVSKLPGTIVSRLQKFNFRRATADVIGKALSKIAKEENIKITDEAISAISESADGSFRDAESILEQLSGVKKEIKKEDVWLVSRVAGRQHVYLFVKALALKNLKGAVEILGELSENGADFGVFNRSVVAVLEKLMLLKIGVDVGLEKDSDDLLGLKDAGALLTIESIQSLIRLFMVADGEMKYYPVSKIPMMLAVVKYCEPQEGDGGESGREPSQEPKSILGLGKDEDLTVVKEAKNKEPETSKAPNKISKTDTKSMLEVEKVWTEFLNKVKGENAQVVALLRATKPYNYDGGSLTLEVFYRFHKDKLEEPKIVRMLDEKMNVVMGHPVRLKFVLAQKESRPTREVKVSDVIDVKSEDLEKIAAEIFSK